MLSARLVAPRTFEVVERPAPVPGPDELLVRLEVIGICGSDTRRGFRAADHAGASTYPLAHGYPAHECIGLVQRGPSDMVGERVLLHPRGLMGLAEQVVVPRRRAAVMPRAGDPASWLMVEPPATVLHALKAMPPVLGQRVLIAGQGTMGLCWTHAVNRLGAAEIVVVDPIADRLAWARSFGATSLVHGSLTGDGLVQPDGHTIESPGEFDVVVEAAGETTAVGGAFRLVRRAGLVVLFGTPPEREVAVPYRTLRDREVRTLCTAPGQGEAIAPLLVEMLSLVRRGWMQPERLVTHRLPFGRVEEAFELYERRSDGVMKVVLEVAS